MHTSSLACWQTSQVLLVTIFRLTKFLTLLGTGKLQIACHRGLSCSMFYWPGCMFWASCCKNLYPDFTEYSPLGLKGQKSWSGWSVGLRGIFFNHISFETQQYGINKLNLPASILLINEGANLSLGQVCHTRRKNFRGMLVRKPTLPPNSCRFPISNPPDCPSLYYFSAS